MYLQEADVLVHVIDAHVQDLEQHITAVEHILTQLGLEDIPCLRFFNKGDLIEMEEMQRLCQRYDGIGGSALEKTSLQVLQEKIAHLLLAFQGPRSGFRESGVTTMNENVISAHGVG